MLGNTINKFKIVTPDTPAAIETYAAQVLRNLIAEKSGYTLEIVKKSAASGGNCIEIGIKGGMDTGLYSVSSSGGTVALTAGSPAGVAALVDSFKALLDSAKSAALDGSQLDFTGKVSEGLAKRYDGTDLRIMTSNVLFTDSTSFETPYRMKCLMQTYLTYLPDIIGLQEARNTQLNALLPYLTGEYEAVPFTSEDGGQVYQQILYLADKYTLIEYGFTRFRYKVIPWGVSWAVFSRNSDGKLFAVTNTHNTIVANTYDPGLSNSVEGVQYRISNCKTVIETIGKIRANHPEIAVFSTGDWNSTVTAESLGPMMQSELMKDAMLTAAGGADNVTNSGHTIGKTPGMTGNIIDHVFISADAAEALYHDVIVNDTVINGSDHCPVYTDVKFK